MWTITVRLPNSEMDGGGVELISHCRKQNSYVYYFSTHISILILPSFPNTQFTHHYLSGISDLVFKRFGNKEALSLIILVILT
jgi:hypothetical protein